MVYRMLLPTARQVATVIALILLAMLLLGLFPRPLHGSEPPAGDCLTIQRHHYERATGTLFLTVKSSNPQAALKAYNLDSDRVIGSLSTTGDGVYVGEFALTQAPPAVTVRSNTGGSVSAEIQEI